MTEPDRHPLVCHLRPAGAWRRDLVLDRQGGGAHPVVLSFAPQALLEDPERLAALARGAELAARVRHPGLVPALGLEGFGDALALAEAHVGGVSLAQLLESGGRLPADVAACVVQDVAAGLSALHACDLGEAEPFTHGAIGPEWVVVGEDGAARLGGLGAGSRSAGVEADVRALAAVLHACLAGEPPADPPRPLDVPGLSPELAALVDRVLGAAPGDAPRTARALAEELARATPVAPHAQVAAYVEAMLPAGEGEREEVSARLDAALDAAEGEGLAAAQPPAPAPAPAPASGRVEEAASADELIVEEGATSTPALAGPRRRAVPSPGAPPVPTATPTSAATPTSPPTPVPTAAAPAPPTSTPTPAPTATSKAASAPPSTAARTATPGERAGIEPSTPLLVPPPPPASSPTPVPAWAAASAPRPPPAAAEPAAPAGSSLTPVPAWAVASHHPQAPEPAAPRRPPIAIAITIALVGFGLGLGIARWMTPPPAPGPRSERTDAAPVAVAPTPPAAIPARPPASSPPPAMAPSPLPAAPAREPASPPARVAAPLTAPARPAAPPSLSVTAEPAAEVLVDGRKVGRAPVTVPVAAGVHEVRLRDAGQGIDARRRVSASGPGTPVHFQLGRGTLEISAPPDVEMIIDGRPVGAGDRSVELWEGTHRVEARRGTAVVRDGFTLAAGETRTYTITPTP